jgi:hypothetical protein
MQQKSQHIRPDQDWVDLTTNLVKNTLVQFEKNFDIIIMESKDLCA